MIIKFSLKVWFKFGLLFIHSGLKNFNLNIINRLDIIDSIIIKIKINVNKIVIKDPIDDKLFHSIK